MTNEFIGINSPKHFDFQCCIACILPWESAHRQFSHVPSLFPLPPLQFGDSQQLRLVRILRSTVMVRVGGGWMALDEFLVKNDPCRGEFKSSPQEVTMQGWQNRRTIHIQLCLKLNRILEFGSFIHFLKEGECFWGLCPADFDCPVFDLQSLSCCAQSLYESLLLL